MKAHAILAAFALVGACGATTQSVGTPLPATESLDIAAAPASGADASSIEAIAQRYSEVSQRLTGIQVATYGNIVRKDRRPIPGGQRSRAKRNVTVIEGKVYDVYQVGSDGKTRTIYVERKRAQ